MNAISIAVFRQWVGQTRTKPAQLSPKGREVLPATEYRCLRVAIKVIIAGEAEQVMVDAIWLQGSHHQFPSEVCVTSGEWLTWPIKEAA